MALWKCVQYELKSRCYKVIEQVALLLQRGRVMLRVIEYVAKSLKIIRNDTLENGVRPD